MTELFVSVGITCIIGAIVGGGLKAFGIGIPYLHELQRQLALGGFGVILLVVGIVVWLEPRPPQSRLLTQSGQLEITEIADSPIEVFYPRPFASVPNLEVEVLTGHMEYELREQRADGFILVAGDRGYGPPGLQLKWTAHGIPVSE